MADVSFSINCGCGYTTKRLEEAEKHSDSTHHKLTFLGAVTPTSAPIPRSQPSTRPRTTKKTEVVEKPEYAEAVVAGMAEISALRQKIRR